MTPADLLEALVARPSLSGEEGALADWLEALLTSWGVAPERSGNNLWFSIGAGARRLLLCSHLDTVPAAADWQHDPLRPTWEDDRLYGLGANDAKGCVAALLGTARRLLDEEEPLRGEVVFALVAEEERGGAQGLTSVLDALDPLDAAVVGEPTGLKVCTAQRGMLILRCEARGVAGHVAHAQAAGLVNAVHVAARDVSRLDELRFAPHPLLGETRAQVTVIEGGRVRNQVPDRCRFYVDLRTTPNLDLGAVVARVRDALESEVHVHSDRYLARGTVADRAIVRAALRATGGGPPVGSSTTSDWAFLGDVPAVKLGPGDSRRSHRADEYLRLDELEAGVQTYTALVRAYLAREQCRGDA